MVRILLELGVNMETRDKYGKTALHWGALYENASNIRLLLEFGANILARDREGWTAHTYAVHGRHATTIQLLSGLVPPMRLRVPMA
jgi:ankyrin repeat protein